MAAKSAVFLTMLATCSADLSRKSSFSEAEKLACVQEGIEGAHEDETIQQEPNRRRVRVVRREGGQLSYF